MNQAVKSQIRRRGTVLLRTAAVVAIGSAISALLSVPQLLAQSPGMSAGPAPSQTGFVKLNTSGDKMTRIGLLPDKFPATNISARELIKFAYGIKDYQLANAPDWIDQSRFDIEMNLEDSRTSGSLNFRDLQQQRRSVVRTLLTDRFKLKAHTEPKDTPIYALVLAGNLPNLSPTPAMPFASSRILNVNGHLSANAVPISAVADELSKEVGVPVIDKTGLRGTYDLTLDWISRTKTSESGPESSVRTSTSDASMESLVEALHQVGLELRSERDRVNIFVIDSLQKPDR